MKITPLPFGFGAEISGFDVHRDGAPEDIAQLKQAYGDLHLLVFRSTERMAPERQVEVAGWFGPIGANRDGAGQPWTVLDNGQAAGSNILPFHSDITFMEYPIEGLSLHPIALPDRPTSTSFVSNALAWDALPEATQNDLRARRARHYFSGGPALNLDWPILEYWHPVCLPHAETGRPLLFVTEHHVDRIEGMSEECGTAMLQSLFAELYAPERRYEHVWRSGDFVIWNNFAIQHARTRASPPSEGPRVFQRVAIGTANFTDQLEAVRRRQMEKLS